MENLKLTCIATPKTRPARMYLDSIINLMVNNYSNRSMLKFKLAPEVLSIIVKGL